MNQERRNKILTILLFVQIGFISLLSKFPHFIEQVYALKVYLFISKLLRGLLGWIPFSIGDLVYCFLIFLIFRFIKRLIKRNGRSYQSLIYQALANLSLFLFCFYFFWGLNYSRLPITISMQLVNQDDEIRTNSYDIEKLKTFTNKILNKVIFLHDELTTADSLPVIVPYTSKEIIDLTSQGYQNLSKKFPQFQYERKSLKKSLFSLPITYMGFAGYFNPLTGEAQVDYLIPKIYLPMTCSHEVAHQLGIASESEANFIGYLAANFHEDKYFQYSANLGALRYALSDIYRYDENLYTEYVKKIPLGVIKNIKESQEFWKRYENPIEPLFKVFYDNYLKINQQVDGLESYNKMVGLLIAYNDKHKLK